jgi:hypothetical protein
MDQNQTSDQMEMFGYTAEGAQQEADKFVEEAGNLEEDISKAASFVVPFYDSGVNISNVVQEYMKPEQERDYDYIKSQFTEAGQSAAIEGGLLLMGGVAGKYGAKGIKALADKVKQYEIDPTAMSAFGAGAIKKKTDKEMISVFPKPERMFPEESRPKGGDYLNPATGEVLSGRNVSSAKLSISPEGKPSFKVSNDNVEEVGSVGKGKTQIKTNLFKKKAGWKWTKAPEGMEDIATLISVENRGKHFYTIETDFSKGVNLKKYPNSKTEPRLRPTVVGEIEIGPQIGNISVRGKEHPVYQSIRTFNKGGAVMDDQMEMAFMEEGGLQDDGMDQDPVSGNEVPSGSLANEVRDDIPAQLSEGEYIVPADVVRFYGVKFFEDLRKEAKRGLADMESNGRIGGEPVPAGGPVNEEDLSDQEKAVLEEIMSGMAEGGEVQNPFKQQQMMYNQPAPSAMGNNQMVMGAQAGTDVSKEQTEQAIINAGQPRDFNTGNFGMGFSFMNPSEPVAETLQEEVTKAPITLYSPDGTPMELPAGTPMSVVQSFKDQGYTETAPAATTPKIGVDTGDPTDQFKTKDDEDNNITALQEIKWGDDDAVMKWAEGQAETPFSKGLIGGAMAGTAVANIRASAIIARSKYGEDSELANRLDTLANEKYEELGPVGKTLEAVFGMSGEKRAERYLANVKEDPVVAATKDKTPAAFVDTDRFNLTKKESKGIADSVSDVTIKGRTDSSGKKAGDKDYKSALVERKERKKRRERVAKAKANIQKNKRDTAVKKAKSISSKVTGKGAKAVSATQKAGAFNKGGLMTKGKKK